MFMRKVTVQNVICTQGLSLILVVLFSTYTELETLFSFISIIKVTTVCDHRYLEKRIICWLLVYNIGPVSKILLLAVRG